MSRLIIFLDQKTGLISVKDSVRSEYLYSQDEIDELIRQGEDKLEEYLIEFNKGVRDAN